MLPDQKEAAEFLRETIRCIIRETVRDPSALQGLFAKRLKKIPD